KKHAVAVVVREGELVRPDHAHEARSAALVIAGRTAVGVGGGEEEQDAAFDERPVVVGEGGAGELLLEPVGDAPAVGLVLKVPIAVVVEDGHGRPAGGWRRRHPSPAARWRLRQAEVASVDRMTRRPRWQVTLRA